MMMDKELISEFVDSCAGRRITVMASNSICRVCVPSRQDGFLPLLWWIRFNVINLSPGGWLMPWGRVGLWTWESRHSERVPGQSWLECTCPWHWAHPPPPSMPSWSFCFRTHLQSIGFCGKKKTNIHRAHHLTTWLLWASSTVAALWLVCTWNMTVFTWLLAWWQMHIHPSFTDFCVYSLLFLFLPIPYASSQMVSSCYRITLYLHFWSSLSGQPNTLSKVQSTKSDFFHYFFPGLPLSGVVELELSTLMATAYHS